MGVFVITDVHQIGVDRHPERIHAEREHADPVPIKRIFEMLERQRVIEDIEVAREIVLFRDRAK
jgi:hypothetical protein